MANRVTDASAVQLDPSLLEAVATSQGSPFYIADPQRLESNVCELLEAFRSYYPNTSIGYSYKTNYLPTFIQAAHDLGTYSEVVSRLEFDLALALGVPANRIIFNGPLKTADDLELALGAGATVNIDSLAEARLVAMIARGGGSEVAVGLRCNLGQATPRSRFGVDFSSEEGKAVLDTLEAAPNVRIIGLHCHYSGDRGASGYRDRTRRMIELHLAALGGRHLEFLNIGGGFSGRMGSALAAQFPAPPSSYRDYAVAIGSEMAAAYGSDGPELILEPGMGILSDAMTLVTRVRAVKHVQTRNLAVVDAAVFNIKPLLSSINLPIKIMRGSPSSDVRIPGPVDVVGHTCMEIDVLHTGYPEAINEGDWVILENVGAYSNVLNAPFIRGTPAIVELTGSWSFSVLRRSSTLDDLLATYRLNE